ncbi:MAG: APC family permease [Bifidobacteriaceae bacterium]|jgi:amino acid transporter|nr:APC family permease [Bifidobacteriaceae bacterium]
MTKKPAPAPSAGSTGSTALQQFGYEQQLKRELTLKDLIVYGLLFMVIVAPFGIFGEVHIASDGMVPFVYLVGLIAMLFTAMSYAQMSRKFPIAGSVYAYVQRGINPHVGFFAGWLILIDYILIPALLYGFAGIWCHDLVPQIPIFAWIVLFVIVNTSITLRGIRFTAVVDWVFFALEVAAVIVFVVVALKYILGPGAQTTQLSSPLSPIFDASKINLSFIAAAASIACLSFLGFDGISTLAEETKNPEKTVGKATFLSLLFIGLIFIGSTWVAELAWGGKAPTEGFVETGFFQVVEEVGGQGLRLFIYLVVIIATAIPNAVAAQSAITRILFAMSRDKLMPAFMSKVHKKYSTPHLAILFIGAFTLVAALIPAMQLVRFINFGGLSSFIVLNFTVFWYFFVKLKQRKTFTDWLKYLVCPWLGVLILGYVWSGFEPLTLIVGFSWLAVGVAIGAIRSKGFRETPEAFKNIQV